MNSWEIFPKVVAKPSQPQDQQCREEFEMEQGEKNDWEPWILADQEAV